MSTLIILITASIIEIFNLLLLKIYKKKSLAVISAIFGIIVLLNGIMLLQKVQLVPFALECELISYDADSCRLVGKILNVSADESIMTNDKIDLSKFHPITYDPSTHHYIALGEQVGNAFSDGRKLK